jgi:hypothetical protein
LAFFKPNINKIFSMISWWFQPSKAYYKFILIAVQWNLVDVKRKCCWIARFLLKWLTETRFYVNQKWIFIFKIRFYQ